jgi:hypothetical protein
MLQEAMFFEQTVAIAYRAVMALYEHSSARSFYDAGGGERPRTEAQYPVRTAVGREALQKRIDFREGKEWPVRFGPIVIETVYFQVLLHCHLRTRTS